jgi:hypothetical protein
MTKMGWVAAAFLAVVGCQSLRSAITIPPNAEGTVQEFTITRPTEQDVLFVIDNSPAMAPMQQALLSNMNTAIHQLALSGNTFQIGMTTTDENCSDTPPTPNPWDGRCGRLFSPDGADPIIRGSNYASGDALVARFNQVVAAIGTNGSSTPQGLQAATDAISDVNTALGRANAGFVRSQAQLAIVIISNSPDNSFANSPTEWAQKIAATKPQSLVVVGTITVDDASDRYSAFANFWPAHLTNAITQSDFSPTISNVTNLAVESCFSVDHPPANGDANNMELSKRVAGQTTFEIAPQITEGQAQNANADGWFYSVDPPTAGNAVSSVCVSGSFGPQLGDTYRLFVLN